MGELVVDMATSYSRERGVGCFGDVHLERIRYRRKTARVRIRDRRDSFLVVGKGLDRLDRPRRQDPLGPQLLR